MSYIVTIDDWNICVGTECVDCAKRNVQSRDIVSSYPIVFIQPSTSSFGKSIKNVK